MRRCIFEAEDEYRVRQPGKQPGCQAKRCNTGRVGVVDAGKQRDTEHHDYYSGPFNWRGLFQLERKGHEIDKHGRAVHQHCCYYNTALRDTHKIESKIAGNAQAGNR